MSLRSLLAISPCSHCLTRAALRDLSLLTTCLARAPLPRRFSRASTCLPSPHLSQQAGGTLQNYNAELVTCIEELREKREGLNRSIASDEEEKGESGTPMGRRMGRSSVWGSCVWVWAKGEAIAKSRHICVSDSAPASLPALTRCPPPSRPQSPNPPNPNPPIPPPPKPTPHSQNPERPPHPDRASSAHQ